MSVTVAFLPGIFRNRRDKSQDYTLNDGVVDPAAQEWLRQGVRAAIEGNREDARYYFVQAVRTDLSYARAWLYLGGVAEDPALTLSCLRKVLQLDPNNQYAHAGLLWAREKLGLIQHIPLPASIDPTGKMQVVLGLPEPEERIQPLLEKPPAAQPGEINRGRLRADESKPTMSHPLAMPAEPGRPGSIGQSVSQDETPRNTPRVDADSSLSMMRRGISAAKAGDRDKARYFFVKAVAADGSNTQAWLYLGGIAQDPLTTLACMERVLESDPDNADAQAGVHWALERIGVKAPAMRWWRR